MSCFKKIIIFLFSLILIFCFFPVQVYASSFNSSAYEQLIDDPNTYIDESVPKFRYFFPKVGRAEEKSTFKSDMCILLIVFLLIMFFSLVVFFRC